ncbi:Maf family protein [Cognatiluteimonas telluris]|jgi:septum formation protein|uniref:Maf family protein n=1 Tax=Cognatiluteimonas telluris TaxID=1104775 RepID=UPI00140BA010
MLHLASQSPRRRDLLALLNVDFIIVGVDVPEHRRPLEPAVDYVRRVAWDKAMAGLRQVPDGWVLGADTEVVLDDVVFGKPRDAADAVGMLRRLSGRTHRVLSAVTLVSSGQQAHALSESEVTFAELDDATIAAYVASGEPEGKAGAYGIQGAAQAFVAHLSGSYSGVMGLPLHETARLLVAAGVVAGAPRVAGGPRGPKPAGDPAFQRETRVVQPGTTA